MERPQKQTEPDGDPGAPEWMVTFSDCMTLLLTFFVLLLSFSSFDERVFLKLRAAFSGALPTVAKPTEKHKDSFLAEEQIKPTKELNKGSEKPTLARGKEDNLKEETEPMDFRSRKVFLIPSRKIFWGRGTLISSEGRSIMATMASFLREVPSRIVISENGREDDKGSEQFGLPRAWAVMKYLTTKQGLDKKHFSISAQGTRESPQKSGSVSTNTETQRVLEIVLLERSIYN